MDKRIVFTTIGCCIIAQSIILYFGFTLLGITFDRMSLLMSAGAIPAVFYAGRLYERER